MKSRDDKTLSKKKMSQKTYHSPKLTIYGDIRTITATGGKMFDDAVTNKVAMT